MVAFFLTPCFKGLNGVCTEWCSSGEKFPDPKVCKSQAMLILVIVYLQPYGVNFPGGIFKYTVRDLSGYTRVGMGM
jgi:integrin alpha FG-GAP repeat containing protein 1